MSIGLIEFIEFVEFVLIYHFSVHGNVKQMNLAACGGIFLDRINRINKIFLYSLYSEHAVYPVKKKEIPILSS